MTSRRQFTHELDSCQQVELQKAHPYGLERFDYYRRSGHSVDEAFMFAMAWARNVNEQRVRRVAHQTGAVSCEANIPTRKGRST